MESAGTYQWNRLESTVYQWNRLGRFVETVVFYRRDTYHCFKGPKHCNLLLFWYKYSLKIKHIHNGT